MDKNDIGILKSLQCTIAELMTTKKVKVDAPMDPLVYAALLKQLRRFHNDELYMKMDQALQTQTPIALLKTLTETMKELATLIPGAD